MRYTDIAWDFDGALYDSYPHINTDMQYVLSQYGLNLTLEEINCRTRVTQGHALKYFAPLCGCSVEELTRVYKERKEGRLSELCRPFPGIPELIRKIAAAGIRNHICSNKPAVHSKKYLDRDGLTPYFDIISGVDKERGVFGKPKPDILNVVLQTREITPGSMLMIGDRRLDIDAAHAAGCPACFFDPDRYNEKPADAEYEAYTAEALQKIIFEG